MRTASADLAKGMAVLLMIQVHLMQLFAREEIFEGLFGKISLFFGGTFVAPAFMAVMGFFLARSHKTRVELYRRGFRILLLAFLLNIGLNFHLFYRIREDLWQVNFWEYIFGVDILWLAAISIFFIAWWKDFIGARISAGASVWWTVLLVLGIVCLAPCLSNCLTVDALAKYALVFIGGKYDWSYFPLLPWLAYPLAGFLVGSLNHQKIPRNIFIVSGSIFFVLLKQGIRISTDVKMYYHHGALFFVWSMALLFFLFVLPHIVKGFLV